MAVARLTEIYVCPVAGAEPVAVDSVEVTAAGLVGDRYAAGVGTFSRMLPDGRAVSLVDAAAVAAFPGGRHRRNLVVEGVDLPALLRREFAIGDLVLRGVRPCPPCGRLSRLTGVDAKALLKGRGGLRAEVVTPGVVRVGDAVRVG